MTVLKHHYWLNFTNHDMEPPTWINVMREPISWFESRFWFKRNGWIHKEGARLHENIEDGEVCSLFKRMLYVAYDISRSGCLFLVVIWSEIRIGQYRDDDHRDDASHFNGFKFKSYYRLGWT